MHHRIDNYCTRILVFCNTKGETTGDTVVYGISDTQPASGFTFSTSVLQKNYWIQTLHYVRPGTSDHLVDNARYFNARHKIIQNDRLMQQSPAMAYFVQMQNCVQYTKQETIVWCSQINDTTHYISQLLNCASSAYGCRNKSHHYCFIQQQHI